ncbi:GntR family transcriptional regulator [Fodinicurvata sediminis]|uniref:GntR family transcriptional regulator n=1 Tax=Fodinicurvata sediminis TaxID=1121832 RepID=UPI0003FF31ED|nr:GntR family transcriptional regulator [Fodinicurvata sediminis]
MSLSEERQTLGLDEATDSEQGKSLTEKAYKRLEELIVTLQLAPGAVLSEAQLAKQLGIGRTPIREALQRLSREGLIVILPRRGILVSEINVTRQLKLLEVRRELERLMASCSARRASTSEKQEFQKLAEGMKKTAEEDDDITFMRLDLRLNHLLCEASRNEYITNAIGLIQSLSRRFWYSHYKEVLDLPLCARLHASLALAISEGKQEEAIQASDDLMDYIEDFTRASLDAPTRY